MLLELTDRGLFCEPGDFYIDPWRPVRRAVITHAHSDHARSGSDAYLCSAPGAGVLRLRLGDASNVEYVAYGEPVSIGGVRVSLHPAGHILGSAQIRVEHRGEIWVVSGDYKIEPDPTCAPFESVQCHTFITESTFGLPVYRWRPQSEVFEEINKWWSSNRDAGRTSVMFGYALGKSQRVLAGIDPSIGPVFCHGALMRLNDIYRETGVNLPPAPHAVRFIPGALVLAPPSANGTPWLRRFGHISTAFASGWMHLRGFRRRSSIDRGFALSDHADWPGLLDAISATRAETVWVTHGYRAQLVRWLQERGLRALDVETRFEGDPAAEESET